MSLIVEDGTGKADAESYISVADADTYHAARGNTTWAALTTAVKEQSLRKATEYIEGYYTFIGYRKTSTQMLAWPRYQAARVDLSMYGIAYWSDTAVPLPVARACAELALVASTEDLSPALEAQALREKVGPIEVQYAPGAIQYKRYRKVDLIIGEMLESSGSNISSKLARV